MGNDAFRKCEYERAVSMYTKAIDHVKDSPVLYNNRALTYIRFAPHIQCYKFNILEELIHFFIQMYIFFEYFSSDCVCIRKQS